MAERREYICTPYSQFIIKMQQVFVRNVDGEGLLVDCGLVEPGTAGGLKAYLESAFGVREKDIYLEQENRVLWDAKELAGLSQSTIYVKVRLLGGKGGFGSLLRGQAPKKKYTTNYESCRDLSGRR